jgi:hypothetical protein
MMNEQFGTLAVSEAFKPSPHHRRHSATTRGSPGGGFGRRPPQTAVQARLGAFTRQTTVVDVGRRARRVVSPDDPVAFRAAVAGAGVAVSRPFRNDRNGPEPRIGGGWFA